MPPKPVVPPKPAAYRLQQRIWFVDLAEDIHHLIFAELLQTSPSTLLSLVRVSKILYQIATPYLYREFVIRKRGIKHNPLDSLSQKSLKGQGASDKANHIRHLIVEDDIGHDALLALLDRIDNLKRFSWNVNGKIHRKVLRKIHTTFPNAKISVRNYNHQNISLDQDMDSALLSSRQLDSLDYLFYTDAQHGTIVGSDWGQFTAALQAGGNCKSLQVHILNGRNADRARAQNEACFDLVPGSVLPPLEELSFTRATSLGDLSYKWGYWGEYQWTAPHCELLKSSMDWSRMRKLDFGDCCPMPFFETMIGLLPNLKSLKFRLPGTEEPLGIVSLFLESIPGLEELHIANLEPHVASMWPAIRKHRATLETLIIPPCRSPYVVPMYIDVDYWNSVMTEFPRVKHLGIDVPFVREEKKIKTVFGRGKVKRSVNKLSEDYMIALMHMPLHTLDLFLHLPDGKCSFADEYRPNASGSAPFPDLNKGACKSTGVAIADIVTSQKGHTLQTLNVNISRTVYADRAQGSRMSAYFQMKKSDRDDADQLAERERWKVVEKESKWRWDMPMW